jgi:hypothetical protein
LPHASIWREKIGEVVRLVTTHALVDLCRANVGRWDLPSMHWHELSP